MLVQVNLLGVCDDPAVLAQQLTHIEMVSHCNDHTGLQILPPLN